MKKIILMFACIMAFASCSNHNFAYNESELVTASYNNAFIKAFGEPSSNQDWGFNDYKLPSSFGKTTRVSEPDNYQWGQLGYDIPSPITEEEKAKVLAVFNQKGAESYTSLIDWDEYFVQQVHKSDNQYTAKDGHTVTSSFHMNQFCTLTKKHATITNWWPKEFNIVIGEEYNDHINDFNGGTSTDYDGTMLMMYTDSYSFGYHCSEDDKFHYTFRMEEIDGSYYLGFDFVADGQNPNQQIERDYIYNDWIVKISPTKKNPSSPTPSRYKVRIIAEDLNANSGSDFDFNDVVFDASYVEGSNQTIITVLAAGGTLPLYIEGREVHELFAEANPTKGITTTTMINTNANNGVNGLSAASFTVDRIIAPWDIDVAVQRLTDRISLKADVGQPSAKIAVDPSFQWCNEREDIRERYPNFTDYVKDTSVNWY